MAKRRFDQVSQIHENLEYRCSGDTKPPKSDAEPDTDTESNTNVYLDAVEYWADGEADGKPSVTDLTIAKYEEYLCILPRVTWPKSTSPRLFLASTALPRKLLQSPLKIRQ